MEVKTMRTRNHVERRYEVVKLNGRYRVRDMSSGELVGVGVSFLDAAEFARDLEECQARQRSRHLNGR
jgi:hypothetical protein